MKQNNNQGLFLSFLFIILIYLFTRSYYSPFFLILLALLLSLAFLKEKNRLFAWVIISFFGGNLILFYFDKFIEGFDINPFLRVIINQLLFIIPILSICYVIKQFNKKISLFFKKPQLNTKIKLNKTYFYIMVIIISVSIVTVIITRDVKMDFHLVLSLFLFAFIHAFLQEVMWRGILLTQFMMITSETAAILFTSVAFALNTTIFGFSPAVFLLYLSFGCAFGVLTTIYKSILPSIIAHALVLIFFFLNGFIQLPI